METIIASTIATMACMKSTNNRLTGLKLQGVTLAPTRESWRPPEEGWVKVNVDGAYSRSANRSACGGLLRDSAGKFLKGFIHPLENGDDLTAEIWACLLGLKIAWSLGIRKVWLESDSSECLDLLLIQGGGSHHRDADVIQEVQRLLNMDWSTKLMLIPRSSNSAADFLAKKGLAVGLGHQEIFQPSTELEAILCQDCNGHYPIVDD